MKNIISTVVLLLIVFTTFAQEKWTLEKCIDYALENNIVIKQYQINSEYRQNEYNQAKFNKLPSVSASASQGVNFGRSETLDGTFDNFTSANTNANVGANVLIWRGGTLKNTIKQNEFQFKASLEDLQKAKDDVTLNIASAYLEILFAQELIQVAEKQVAQTKQQIERSKQLVQAGTLAEGALLEAKAQLAREELELVNSKNNLQLANLNLAQLLELDDYSNFEVSIPELPELRAQMSLTSSANVFEKAVENRPEIKSAEYSLMNAQTQLDIAKGGRMPTLSAYAGVSNNYIAFENAPSFNDQISKNINENLGVNLNIPIFSKFQNRTNIENSKLQIENNQLDLENAKKNLRRQIEQAYVNAKAAMERYNANKAAVNSMEESFRYIEEKFNVGRVNPLEYN
ncbi:MAG TPA: TolC family protein, partial [Prolixibacteraceae bacterium]|nr:TolC family protein [Prolixibacteraceae bacterium]